MIITSKFNARCTCCSGYITAGDQCDWEKGQGVRHVGDCPAQPAPAAPAVSNIGPGVFRVLEHGAWLVYVVKFNREKTRLYAKQIVESPPRLTENGYTVDFETRYAPGVVYRLTEADRWELADAQAFLTRYSRCIVCGAHLKAAKSVAASIGPVCARYFANSTPAAKLDAAERQVEAQLEERAYIDSERAAIEREALRSMPPGC